MEVTITIPERTHQEFGHSLSKLLRILNDIRSAINQDILIDFTQARMLNPFFLGGLACAIKFYQHEGRTINFKYDNNFGINNYLQTIYFPGCHAPVEGEEDTFIASLDRFKSKTYIPIISLPTGNSTTISTLRERSINAVLSILRLQLKYSEKDLSPISYLIDELTHNINDHSQAEDGYIFAQYYPASNYLDLCICDHGIGIYNSYFKSNKFHPSDEKEAIEFALIGMSAKDRPESKGFGLSTSRNMLVNGLKGNFFLMSGNTAYMQSVENKGIIDLPDTFHYQGNYIALRIPTIKNSDFNMYNYVE